MRPDIKALLEPHPESWTPWKIGSLVSYIEALESEKVSAQRTHAPWNCLIRDAVGFTHEFDLARVGHRDTNPPMSFLLPLRVRTTAAADCTEVVEPTKSSAVREFRLVGVRSWDGMFVYEEVV